jgi:hypothetical protein
MKKAVEKLSAVVARKPRAAAIALMVLAGVAGVQGLIVLHYWGQ